MKSYSKKVKALGLSSGGLDSILSALVLKRQNIDVQWITFVTPFFSSKNAQKASEKTGISLIEKDITTEYIKLLKNPPGGYGKNMNPCKDCHSLMFNIAGKALNEIGGDFLFSGEVLGQRPMSQTRPSLRYVEKHSEFDGYILRPLSAKKLDETIPEKNGLVNRDLLLDISGRSRKIQMNLAKEFGINDYPAPAGGCLLTDKNFSTRLKDFFKYQENNCNANSFHLLKYGRHFRFDDGLKIIVGRTQMDNQQIFKYHNPITDIIIKMCKYPGPTVLIQNEPIYSSHNYSNNIDSKNIEKAATLCVAYSKAPQKQLIDIQIVHHKEKNYLKIKHDKQLDLFMKYLI
jgi:tRNA-uridine 2-sulfurtransferase